MWAAAKRSTQCTMSNWDPAYTGLDYPDTHYRDVNVTDLVGRKDIVGLQNNASDAKNGIEDAGIPVTNIKNNFP